MSAMIMRSSSSLVAASRSTSCRRVALRVRASEEPTKSTTPVDTPAAAPMASTSAPQMSSIPAAAVPTADASSRAEFGDVMAFSGAVPEIANGRLAMLGFVAALGAELSSGESVLRQWSEEPTGINLVFVLFIVASLVPALTKTPREAFGPFTPAAEMLNGRAAMIGFASLIAIELARGAALF